MANNRIFYLIKPKNVLIRRYCSVKPHEEKVLKSVETEIKSSPVSNTTIKASTKLTDFDKKVLVFVGRYKTTAEIPNEVSQEVMMKARSKARIKTSNYLMILTVIGCLGFAYSGRKASARGESVSKMNLDWHKEINEKSKSQ